jgi:hypothetical protein
VIHSQPSGILSASSGPLPYHHLSKSLPFLSWGKQPFPPNSTPANGLTEQSTQQPPSAESQSPSPQQHQQPRPIYPWSVHTLKLPPTLLSENAPPSGPYCQGRWLIVPLWRSCTRVCTQRFICFFDAGSIRNSLGNPRRDSQPTCWTWRCTHQQRPFDLGWGTRVLMRQWSPQITRFIYSTLVRWLFWCQDRLQLIRASLTPVSREWTRVVVNGPRPVCRCGHGVTMVGSKLFIFGGQVDGKFT